MLNSSDTWKNGKINKHLHLSIVTLPASFKASMNRQELGKGANYDNYVTVTTGISGIDLCHVTRAIISCKPDPSRVTGARE